MKLIFTANGTTETSRLMKDGGVTFHELSSMAEHTFGVSSPQLSYHDDEGDLCRITRDAELQEAIRIFGESTIKVIVEAAPAPAVAPAVEAAPAFAVPMIDNEKAKHGKKANKQAFKAWKSCWKDNNKDFFSDKKEFKKAFKAAKQAAKRAWKEEDGTQVAKAPRAEGDADVADKRAEKEVKWAAKRAKKEAKWASKRAEKQAKIERKQAVRAAQLADKNKPMSACGDLELERALQKMDKLAFKVQKLKMRIDALGAVVHNDFPHRRFIKCQRKAHKACASSMAKAQMCQQKLRALQQSRPDSVMGPPQASLEGRLAVLKVAEETSSSSSSSSDTEPEVKEL